MRVKNGYFILTTAEGESAWSDDGIWDGDEFVDMSVNEKWIGRPLRDPYAVIKSSPLRDYLYAAPYRCVSERAYKLIVANLKVWSGIEWTKIRVLNHKRKYLADYWWLRRDLSRGLEALDLDNAVYTKWPPHPVLRPAGTIVVDEVEDWVLDSRKIGDLDWFQGDKLEWFTSPKAKKLIEENGLSGFKFTPVDVWQYK